MAENNTIRVYRLISVNDISSNAKLIARAFFGMPSLKMKGVSFFMNNETGSFTYKNESQVFLKNKPDLLPKTEHEAIAAANAFVLRANNMVQNQNEFIHGGLKPLFLNLKPLFATGVVNPIYFFLSHWEVVFRPFVKSLPTDKKESPVLNVEVKIKIGKLGQVIGVDTNWIPILSSFETDRVSQKKSDEKPINTIVVYKQDVKQRMLMPYYVN